MSQLLRVPVTVVGIAGALVACCLLCRASLGRTGTSSGPVAGPLRIGVYDSRAVAVAAARGAKSDVHEPVRDLQRQLNDAQAAGDEQRAREIRARGQNLQTVKHLQAFSNAPVDEYLAKLNEQLPQLARDAGVSLIVARVDFQTADVQVVDVTDALVSAFEPDEKTMSIVRDLRKRKPLPLAEVLGQKP